MLEWFLLVFGTLLLAHLLYDFHWQGDFVGVMKSKYDFILFIHCLTYTLCISAVLYFFGIMSIIKFLFIFSTHWVVDRWKCRGEDKEKSLTVNLWIDQGLHLLVLIAIMFGA